MQVDDYRKIEQYKKDNDVSGSAAATALGFNAKQYYNFRVALNKGEVSLRGRKRQPRMQTLVVEATKPEKFVAIIGTKDDVVSALRGLL